MAACAGMTNHRGALAVAGPPIQNLSGEAEGESLFI
jgi:hypothetical protein